MQSHCLFHQERVATHRCVSCSKPLCDSCIQSYPDGVYCSTDCHDKAAEASVRLAKITEDEKALEMVKSLGYLQAPVVITDDDHWAGFRPDKIAALHVA